MAFYRKVEIFMDVERVVQLGHMYPLVHLSFAVKEV